MKRILSMVLIMSLTVFAFAGCSEKPAETTEETTETAADSAETTEEAAE